MDETPFEIVLTGRHGADDLIASWRTEAGRRAEPAIEALIAAEWARRQTVATSRGALLFNGPLCRLDRWSLADGVLRLALGPTDYRAFLGTNVANLTTIQARHPADWRAFLADPLGVCGVLVSADRWLLVMQRSQRVAEYPGWHHVVGGHPTREHHDGFGGISPFLALQEEIMEETGLTLTEIGPITCLGLIRNRATAKPELVFSVPLTVPRATVEGRLRARPDRPEDAGWTWLNDDAAAIQAFLTRHAGRVAPAGAACLTVYARQSPVASRQSPV